MTHERTVAGGATLVISLLALIASAFSAYVGAVSARLSKSSTLVSRRPIVAVDKAYPAEPLDFARFTFKNAGTSPALDVLIRGKSELRAPREKPDFDHYSDSESKGVVSAGMTFDQGIVLPRLTQQDISAVQAQTKLLYVHGWVGYRDMWHEDHWLKFCFKLGPMMQGYYSCSEHNSLDN
jgi:hypothetical protein